MRTRTKVLAVAAVAAVAALPAAAGPDADTPITGDALDDATRAALDHVGGGEVTETEVGDEESMYEVEITLEDGSQIDVQLDEGFNVVGSEADDDDSDESGDDSDDSDDDDLSEDDHSGSDDD